MVRNISSAKCQTVLFDPLVEPYQVLLLWNRVDMGVISMKVYSVFPKAPGLEHHYPIIYYHIQDNRARGLQSWIIRKRKLWQPRKSTRTWSWYLLTTSLSMQMWKKWAAEFHRRWLSVRLSKILNHWWTSWYHSPHDRFLTVQQIAMSIGYNSGSVHIVLSEITSWKEFNISSQV